jgi:hypothetical protein
MSESGDFEAHAEMDHAIVRELAAPSAADGGVREKKDKKDKHSSGHGGHKKDRKDREGGAEGDIKKEKKERVDYRAMLCETCKAALKLEDDEQMEDLDAVSKTQPALHHAAAARHIECLQALLRIGNQCEGVNEAFKGRTALHVAIMNGDVACCKCLIDAGADGAPAWQVSQLSAESPSQSTPV